MLVTCEKCHTKYKLSINEVKKVKSKGRILKCGNCHHLWLLKYDSSDFKNAFKTHNPTDPELINRIKLSTEESLILREIITDKKINDYFKYSNFQFLTKIIFYILLFFSILTFLITKKNQLLDKPLLNIGPSLLGLTDNTMLQFDKVVIAKSSFAKNSPLLLSGFVVNKSDKIKKIPDLRIKFLNKSNYLLEVITYEVPLKYLEAGESFKISNKIVNYPNNTHNIELEIGNYLEFLLR